MDAAFDNVSFESMCSVTGFTGDVSTNLNLPDGASTISFDFLNTEFTAAEQDSLLGLLLDGQCFDFDNVLSSPESVSSPVELSEESTASTPVDTSEFYPDLLGCASSIPVTAVPFVENSSVQQIVPAPMPVLGSDVEDPFAVLVPTPFYPITITPQIQFIQAPAVDPSISIEKMQYTQSGPAPARKASNKRKNAASGVPSPTSGSDGHDPLPNDAANKKIRRLAKNREAAQQFRHRQKNYIANLEAQVVAQDAVNKDLSKAFDAALQENQQVKNEVIQLRQWLALNTNFATMSSTVVSGVPSQ